MKKKKGLIVVSDYYYEISKNLLYACETNLKKSKYLYDIKIVSGSLEIPTLISHFIKKKKYKFYIALGCIVKGQTPHFEFISSAITNSLISMSIDTQTIITNGIITSLNYSQAKERSSKKRNKGIEAANAAISLMQHI